MCKCFQSFFSIICDIIRLLCLFFDNRQMQQIPIMISDFNSERSQSAPNFFCCCSFLFNVLLKARLKNWFTVVNISFMTLRKFQGFLLSIKIINNLLTLYFLFILQTIWRFVNVVCRQHQLCVRRHEPTFKEGST